MIKCSYPTGIFISYTKVAHMFFSLVYCAEKFKQNKTSELESSELVFHLVLFILFHQHHFLFKAQLCCSGSDCSARSISAHGPPPS